MEKGNDILILPVSSTESHGNLLPIGTDNLVAERIAEEAGEKTNMLAAPTVCYECTSNCLGYADTISLTGETLITALKEIYCFTYIMDLKR